MHKWLKINKIKTNTGERVKQKEIRRIILKHFTESFMNR